MRVACSTDCWVPRPHGPDDMADRQPSQREPNPKVAGVLLAAGGRRRLGGRPKALLDQRGRPPVEPAVRALRNGGCGPLHVVLAAAAEEVRARADLTGCAVSVNPGWEEGMGSSLRLGLAALIATDAAAARDLPLDQPWIGADAVARGRLAFRSPMSLAAARPPRN
ncbi:4-diphosphocytidyl-2C-methyl-D-erythritol synthase [Streptomyces badius]